MASITTWTRLETQARDTEMEEGLRAEVHDPLWLLARQWQFGEFQGADGGSPVAADIVADSSPVTAYFPGPLNDSAPQGVAYDSAALPLEALVERESVRPSGAAGKRLAAEAGLHFLRLLSLNQLDVYRQQYIDQYPFAPPAEAETTDDDSRLFLTLMAGRVPDGDLLYEEVSRTLAGTRDVPVTDDASALRALSKDWFAWYKTLLSDPGTTGTAWQPERMEYAFAVSAPGSDGKEIVLAAPEYVEGRLDWYSFVRQSGSKLGASGSSTTLKRSALPSPLSFRGSPARRWWEFEDARTDFGSMQAAPEDLARMMLAELALTHGNDWFVVPLDLDIGSVTRIVRLDVRDTFGSTTAVSPYTTLDGADRSWRLFCISREEATPEMLFLPPVTGPVLQAGPLEECLFLRDELANMAWAVERLVESPAGLPLDRFAAYQERQQSAAAGTSAADAETPVYRLATTVPDYWFPLLPQRADDVPNDPALYLKLGSMPAGSPDARPLGRILEGGGELVMHSEEVPREGARVFRAYQYARWLDGSTHVWIGRSKQFGCGEGSSGLRFDAVEPL